MGQPPTPPRARQGTVPRYNPNGCIPMSKSHSRMPRQHEQVSSAASESVKPSGLKKDYKAEIELKKSRVTELRTQINLREAASRDKAPSLRARAENKYDNDFHDFRGSYDNDNLLDEYCSDKEKPGIYELDEIQQQEAAELDDAIEQIDSLLRKESESYAASAGQYRNRGYGALKAQSSVHSLRAEKDASTPEISPLSDHSQREARDERRMDRNFTGTTSQGGMAPTPSDPSYHDNPGMGKQMSSHVQGLHHHLNSVVGRLTKAFEGSNNWVMDQILRNVESMSDTLKIVHSRTFDQNANTIRLQQSVTDVCDQVVSLRHDMRRSEERLQKLFEFEMSKLRRDLHIQGASSSLSPSDSNTPSRLPVPGARVHFAQNASETPGSKTKYLRTKKEPEAFKEEKENAKPVKERELPTPKSVSKHAESHGGITQQHRSGEQHNLLSPSTPHHASSKNTGTFFPQRKASILKDPTQASSGSPNPKQVKLSLGSVSEDSQAEKPQKPKKPVEATSSRNDEDGVKVPQKKSSMLFNFRRRKDNDGGSGNNNNNTNTNSSSSQPFSSTTSKFLRTPRRNKNASTKAASSDNLRKSAASTVGFSRNGAPPVPPIPTGLFLEGGKNLSCSAQGSGRLSPGSIHPSMRNKRQQEIVDEREREHARKLSMQSSSQDQSSVQSSTAGADGADGAATDRSRQQVLRSSRSLFDLGEGRPSIASSSSPSLAHATPSPYFSDRSFSSGQFFYESPRFDTGSSSTLQPLLEPQGYQKTTPYGERRPEGNWI